MVSVDTMSCYALSSFCPSGSPCGARLLIVLITAAWCCIFPLLVLVIDCMTAATTWSMTCKNWLEHRWHSSDTSSRQDGIG
jgi:hypothetical protein